MTEPVGASGSIANLDDAIGYADASDADQATGVKTVSLDEHAATLTDIRDHDYPFWTVEYLYSNTRLEPETLSDTFRNFLLAPESRSTMASFQYYACAGDLDTLCDRR